MGRKRLSDDTRRDKPLRIRLNDEERTLVDSVAEADGVSTAGWARLLILAEARRRAGESNPNDLEAVSSGGV